MEQFMVIVVINVVGLLLMYLQWRNSQKQLTFMQQANLGVDVKIPPKVAISRWRLYWPLGVMALLVVLVWVSYLTMQPPQKSPLLKEKIVETNEEITKLEGGAIVLQHEPIPKEIEVNLNGQIIPALEKFGFLVRGRVLLFEGPGGEQTLQIVRDSLKNNNGLVMVKYKYQE